MGRLVAGSSGVVLFAAWGACAERYATVGGGAYNDGVFVPLLMLAFALSTVAGFVTVRSWRGESGGAVAALAVLPAVAVVLLLALAIGLRG
jgi:hypothetical protein